jgi:hypothetical protein
LNGRRPANTQAVRSVREPGLQFQYSGGGTTITKKICMDITGQAYDVYMQKQVLDPMGMTSSFYTQPPAPTAFPLLATAYYANGSPVKDKFHIYPEQAPDGLWTNPTDLARFIIETQLSLQGKSNKVLSKELTTAMLTPYIDKAAALGVFIERRGEAQYFLHGGSNVGFRCQYYGSLTNGNGVVVMVNSDIGIIQQEIINSVATVYQWKDFYQPVQKTIVPVSVDTLKEYAGEYLLGDSHLVFTLLGDHLFMSQDGAPPLQLYFTSNSDFFFFEVPAEIRFVRNAQGVTDAIAIKQNGSNVTARKK